MYEIQHLDFFLTESIFFASTSGHSSDFGEAVFWHTMNTLLSKHKIDFFFRGIYLTGIFPLDKVTG